jgi:quinoprotein glucose dehydrogenase
VRFVIGPGEGEGADTPKANAPPPPGGGGNALNVQGLPLVRPPYGSISAISLERGEIVWKIAHGDTPDAIRNHPALKGLNIPRTGQPSGVVTAVTKTLLLAGDPQVTTTPDHPRGAILHAYDKATGNEVGRVWMPAQQSGGVMTYMLNGKQYIVVAVSGGNYSGEYIAFTLPSS